MRLGDFEELLKTTMGLDPASIGTGATERAVKLRMIQCALDDVSKYWDLVRTSQEELQQLIEVIVVPETWFFRGPEAFRTLSQIPSPSWLAERPLRQLRLLSLPCSGGEEPYSMAIALLDGGLSPERFFIEGVDISRQALAKAQRAVYGSNSFRGAQLQFRAYHFEPLGREWVLSEAVKKQVRFQAGNVLAADFLPGQSLYDVIFCRNLLIYFDLETQARVVAVLSRLLREEGHIFVGPAEAALMLNHGYVPLQIPQAFAFRRNVPTAEKALRLGSALPSKSHRSPVPIVPSLPAQQLPVLPAAPVTPTPLETAKRLADEGKFVEAAAACRAQLELHGTSAEALYWLGLVCSATHDSAQAEHNFRKALYLDPNHEEALMHLALLLEIKGDVAGGNRLRLRAQRRERQN